MRYSKIKISFRFMEEQVREKKTWQTHKALASEMIEKDIGTN